MPEEQPGATAPTRWGLWLFALGAARWVLGGSWGPPAQGLRLLVGSREQHLGQWDRAAGWGHPRNIPLLPILALLPGFGQARGAFPGHIHPVASHVAPAVPLASGRAQNCPGARVGAGATHWHLGRGGDEQPWGRRGGSSDFSSPGNDVNCWGKPSWGVADAELRALHAWSVQPLRAWVSSAQDGSGLGMLPLRGKAAWGIRAVLLSLLRWGSLGPPLPREQSRVLRPQSTCGVQTSPCRASANPALQCIAVGAASRRRDGGKSQGGWQTRKGRVRLLEEEG